MENLGPIIFPGLGGLEINPPRGFTIPGTNFVIYYYGIIICPLYFSFGAMIVPVNILFLFGVIVSDRA